MEVSAIKNNQSSRLIYFGVLLFSIGLIIGLIVPILANLRMGVSSHIEGVLNGMFLIIFWADLA
jgi:(hydroxyamino)benzene mutase